MTAGVMSVLTIGHPNGSLEDFLGLLDGHAVEVVVDVRSSPSSRYSPHFSGGQLRRALSLTSHRYLFMGDVLGGRPRTRATTMRTDSCGMPWWRLSDVPGIPADRRVVRIT